MTTRQITKRLIDGYVQMVASYESRGWNGYLLTFTYNQMKCPRSQMIWHMQNEVERVYSILVTRVVRDPTDPKNINMLPFFLCLPDYPVYKKEKVLVREFKVNEGRHLHAIAYVPPESRLKTDLSEHISKNLEMYVGENRSLAFLHAKPIDRTPGWVVDYVCKSMKRGMINSDEVLILPKARNELSDIRQSAYPENWATNVVVGG